MRIAHGPNTHGMRMRCGHSARTAMAIAVAGSLDQRGPRVRPPRWWCREDVCSSHSLVDEWLNRLRIARTVVPYEWRSAAGGWSCAARISATSWRIRCPSPRMLTIVPSQCTAGASGPKGLECLPYDQSTIAASCSGSSIISMDQLWPSQREERGKDGGLDWATPLKLDSRAPVCCNNQKRSRAHLKDSSTTVTTLSDDAV